MSVRRSSEAPYVPTMVLNDGLSDKPSGIRLSEGAGGEFADLIAGRYEICGLLGIGGMGDVYRAHDRALDETVALKLLHPELCRDAAELARFRHEVKLARRVTHRNVARTFDFGKDGDLAYLTMELIDGESLAQRLARLVRLPIERAVMIALDVAAGLAAAHTAGVIHRDLKPGNILLATDERVAITDFGIAVAVEAIVEQRPRWIVGTPPYMAPEQLTHPEAIDGRVDVYALGLVLYEMLTGQLPWTGDDEIAVATARLHHPPRDPRELVPTLPREVAELVLSALTRSADLRLPSIEAFAARLSALGYASGAVPGPNGRPAATEKLYAEARSAYHDFWRTSESIALFERALAQSPHDPRVLAGSSLALSRATGMDVDTTAARDAARARAELAVRLAPSSAGPHVALGVAHLHDGSVVAATSHVRRALDLAPTQIDALEQAARLLVQTRALTEGLEYAALAVEHEPRLRDALMPDVVRAHALLGRWDEVDRELGNRPEGAGPRMSYWLTRIRLALWRGDPAENRCVLSELSADAFPHKTFAMLYARFLGAESVDSIELQLLDDRAESDWCSARQRAFFYQLAAEVHSQRNDTRRALVALESAVQHGLFDEAWIDRCPALDAIRDIPRFTVLRAAVKRRGELAVLTLVR